MERKPGLFISMPGGSLKDLLNDGQFFSTLLHTRIVRNDDGTISVVIPLNGGEVLAHLVDVDTRMAGAKVRTVIFELESRRRKAVVTVRGIFDDAKGDWTALVEHRNERKQRADRPTVQSDDELDSADQ